MKNYTFNFCFYLFLNFFYIFSAFSQSNVDSLERILSVKQQNDTTKVHLLTTIAKAYLQYSTKIDTARRYTEQALELATQLNKPITLAMALDAKGVYERSTANYITAIKYHEKALTIANDFQHIDLQILINNNIGVAYRRMGDNSTALPYHLKALELAQQINNEYNISYALNCLGNVYYLTEEYDKSMEHFRKSYKLDIKNNNLLGISINLNNIGNVFRQKKAYDSALRYYEKSLEINKKIKNYKGIAICFDDLGMIYLKSKDYVKALSYLKQALQILNSSKDKIYVATIYMHLGEVYIDNKQPQKAIYYLETSIEMAKNIKAKRVIQDSYKHLSTVYHDMGNETKSLETYKIFMSYKDTLMTEEKTTQMAYLQAKFDNESKNREIKSLQQEQELQEAKFFNQKIIGIALFTVLLISFFVSILLFQKNSEKQLQNKQLHTQQVDLMQQKNKIQLQKDELDKANLVKDRLFSIIGHDLRSPFNTIKGFIAVLKAGGLSPDEIQSVAGAMEQQLNYTLNLLNNLLYWSWSQMQGITANPSDFYVNTIFETNVAMLLPNAQKKHIELRYTIDKKLKVKADENMTDTVIRNLLANALKFTYHNGEVIISYVDDTDRYIFCISDTGVGMNELQMANLFGIKANSTIGTAYEKGTGLGLQICREFLEKNGGKIWVTSELNKGSKFYFTLPKA